MKRVNNDQGYALLLVLFLVFFILLASAVFIQGSISNAKQEKNVDMNHLSVVAAEMGVEFFTVSYSNHYYGVQKHYLDQYTKKFVEEKSKLEKKYNKPDELKKQIELLKIELRKNLIEDIRQSLRIYVIPEPPKNVYFKKDSKAQDIITSDVQGIYIKGIVQGKYQEGKEAILNYSLSFQIPHEWIGNESGGDMPEGLKECPKGDEITGKKCKISSDGTHQRNELEIEESHVYTSSNLMITEDLDIEEKSKVIINGFLKVHGKKNNEDEGEFDIEDSDVFVNQDVDVKGELEMENSYLYVGKDLMVSDDIELEEKSKICVEKNVKISGEIKIEKGSIIYFKGNLIQPKKHERIIKLNEDDFNRECNKNFSYSELTTWSPPKVSVDY